MSAFGGIGGRRTPRVELHHGTSHLDPSWPVITAAESGFHPLDLLCRPAIQAVRDFCRAMRDAEDGMYLGFFSDPAGKRRFALVQSNRSDGKGKGFYERHWPDPGRAWPDYYFAAGHALFAEADSLWGASDMVVAHPSGHGWGPPGAPDLNGMPEAFLEGLGHLLDVAALSVRRIHFHDCCLESPAPILAAMRNVEAVAAEKRAGHRPLRSIAVDPVRLGIDPSADCRILRVELLHPGD